MLSLFSPAKLNLFFRVLGKRKDGYHEVASLFQAIDWGDTLTFSLAQEDSLTCSDPSLSVGSDNLINKACKLFRQKMGIASCFAIHLDKQIPVCAGMGGGSSNAATTLWALNELTGKYASIEDLMRWSAELGSDVTFFLSSGTAYCTGRGEIVKSLDPIHEEGCWVVKPPYGLSTPAVFQALDLKSLVPRDPEEALCRLEYFNDLESAAFKLSPQLGALKQKLLDAGFQTVTLTGSGTAFFCRGEGIVPEGLMARYVSFISRSDASWFSQVRHEVIRR